MTRHPRRRETGLIAEWARAFAPDVSPELREAVRDLVSDEELSGALGARWPDISGPMLETDLTKQRIRAEWIANDFGTSRPPRRLERTPAFAVVVLRVYDLFASRLLPQRRTLAWARGETPQTYNARAAELTAEVLNQYPWSSRPLTAASVRARVQRRAQREVKPR